MKIKLCWNYKSVMCMLCGNVDEHVFPEYLDEHGIQQFSFIPVADNDIWDRCPKCKEITRYSPYNCP